MATEMYHGGPVQGRGKSQLFIKPIDAPETEWKELNGPVISDIILEEGNPPFAPLPESGHKKVVLDFTVKLKTSVRKRMMLLIQQEFGLLKKPKCTYKTIKRDCAKRNR